DRVGGARRQPGQTAAGTEERSLRLVRRGQLPHGLHETLYARLANADRGHGSDGLSFSEGLVSRKLLLLVSVSLAAAAWPVAEAAEEIAPAELAIMAAAFALILALQCGALLLAGRFANDKLVGILAALL